MLRVGQRVWLDGERYRVARVNDCRAVLVPIRKVVRKFYDRLGLPVRFAARGRPLSVSVNAELESAS